jgi:uncharacterized protein (TIGR03545 family)
VTVFRWKAIVPLVVFAGLVAVLWTLYVDRLIRLAIEAAGTEVVGAKVDLASARLRLMHGDLVLRDLAVTNPESPMTNLFETGEIVVDLDVPALLEKKAVVETLAVREVRFGTARRVSGALARRSPTTGLVTRRVLGWAHSIPTPSIDLAGLGELAEWHGVNADSLRTLREARAVAAMADSLQHAWEAELREIDPSPVVDSAPALADRLRGVDLRRLGVSGLRDATTSARNALTRLRATKDRLGALEHRVQAGVAGVRTQVGALDAARAADYAYARSLVHVPSLQAPDISAAVFTEMAMERLKPLLTWTSLAEQYLPPGLDPRRSPGPVRLRRAGTTVTFPKAHELPRFLVRYADASLAIGGASATSGAYRARLAGLTTEPALYGGPLTFSAARAAAAVGPRDIRIGGSLDHVGVIRDSVSASLGGVGLPSVSLAAVGARLDLNAGTVELSLARVGDSIAGRWLVRSDSVGWSRLSEAATATGPAPRIGTKAWADALLWRSVSSLRGVEIEASFSGPMRSPRVVVASNVGVEVARSLQREVGAEVARAEARARAEVDRLVQRPMSDARAKITSLESGVQARLSDGQQRLAAVQADLEQRVRDLGRGIPGLRLP